jgi:glycosyltransferase involved in cell wall biosynthesis
MKSLLICSSTFPLGEGDRRTARFVYDLAAALTERFQVTALAPHHPGTALAEKLGDVEVRRFKYFLPSRLERLADGTGIMANVKRSPLARIQPPFLLWWFRRAVRRLSRNYRFDAVNTHWIVPAGWAAGPVAADAGIPHILTVHAADVFFLKRVPWGRRVAARVIGTADKVFADSEFIIRETSRLIGRDVDAIATTAGVNASSFAPAHTPAEAKARLGWPDVPIVLFVGKMVEKKGMPYLVRAMAKVKSEVSAARLVAAGDGPELERAKALARELELGDAVAFVGPKSHDELKLMYNAADILAVPSVVARDGETEGMPTVILEAFAAACPVVGSRVAGIPEFVRDGETGFLANAADSGDLAAKIVETLKIGRDRFASSCLTAAAGRDFKKIARLCAEAAEA